MKSTGNRFAQSSLRLAFLLMGFSFSVMQTLMARELLVSYAGNELSIGLVLGSWLILEALGSGLLGRLARRARAGASSYAALQVALALLLPLSVYAAFTVRRIVAGEGVERIFPLHSPRVKDVNVTRRGKVRRSRLYYLRDRVGKATKVKELVGSRKGKGGKKASAEEAKVEA